MEVSENREINGLQMKTQLREKVKGKWNTSQKREQESQELVRIRFHEDKCIAKEKKEQTGKKEILFFTKISLLYLIY